MSCLGPRDSFAPTPSRSGLRQAPLSWRRRCPAPCIPGCASPPTAAGSRKSACRSAPPTAGGTSTSSCGSNPLTSRPFPRADRGQERRCEVGDLPLVIGEIRDPQQAYLSVAPRLLGCPLDALL